MSTSSTSQPFIFSSTLTTFATSLELTQPPNPHPPPPKDRERERAADSLFPPHLNTPKLSLFVLLPLYRYQRTHSIGQPFLLSEQTMAQILADLFYSFGNCLNCFPGSPTLKINNRSFKIQRLLGEVRKTTHTHTLSLSLSHSLNSLQSRSHHSCIPCFLQRYM